MAILIALLSTAAIAAGEFVASDVAKRTRSHEVTSGMYVAGVALTGVVAIFWPGDPTGRDLLFGALAGVANGTAILLLYTAYSRGSLRSAAPAAAVVMSCVPIVWDVVSGTSPSSLTWLGLALGVAAIGVSSYQPGDANDDRYALPIAVVAGAIFGLLLIFLGEIGDESGGTPIFVQRFVGLIIAVAVTRATGPRILAADPTDRWRSLLVGVFATTAVILFVVALQSGGSLAVVSVIGSQYAGLAVLLNVALRGHRMRWWQALGLAGASLSVALIAIG